MNTTTKPQRYGLKKHAMTARQIVKSPKFATYYVEYSDLATHAQKYYVEADGIPEGWKFLGKGWSRFALLGPDGKVYKVTDGGEGSGAEDCSISEAQRWINDCERARSLGVHLARSYWHADARVLTMEYCPKGRDIDDSWESSETSLLRQLGINDCHKGNAWYDQSNRLVVVDYAG